MNRKLEADALAALLIEQYWIDFKSGVTQNFLNPGRRYRPNDKWASERDWVTAAESCIDSDKNLVQALEVLLHFEFEEYFSVAEKFVSEWGTTYADIEDLHFLIAMFPQEHPLRHKLFDEQGFDDVLIRNDIDSPNAARHSLIFVQDEEYCQFHGNYVNDLILTQGDDLETMVEAIVPLLVELGERAKDYVEEANMRKVKNFFLNSLQFDANLVKSNKFLNGLPEDFVRPEWVLSDIVYPCFSLGWLDILHHLKESDWYWKVAFDNEFVHDDDSYELLAWSCFTSNQDLKDRAITVMNNNYYERLFGAIAWTRLKEFESQ